MSINRLNAFKGQFGLEMESLRVDSNGRLSSTDHTKYFKEDNSFISRDFSESQIEMITPPCSTVNEALDFLVNIKNVVLTSIGDELLWPQSNPPILPDESEILIANYSDSDKKDYREYLALKYGRKKSVLSGIHFNLSFSDSYINDLNNNDCESRIEFQNRLYLQIAKYFMKYRWFFIRLTAAGPVFHSSFSDRCVQLVGHDYKENCISEGMQSLRNSLCGYRNNEFLTYDYSSLSNYKKSISTHIDNGVLINESEVYESVRIKTDDDGNAKYLELRFIDLNPELEHGVNLEDLKFLHMMFVYFSTLEDFEFDESSQIEAEFKSIIANDGTSWKQDDEYNVYDFEAEANNLIKNLENVLAESDIEYYDYSAIIKNIEYRLTPGFGYADKILKGVSTSDYITYHLDKAKEAKNRALMNPYNFYGNESLELSTKILLKSAIKMGVQFKILDERENFVFLENRTTGQSHFVKQATKTNLDRYGSVLAMENKNVTKYILSKDGINVPKGYAFTSIEDALSAFEDSRNDRLTVIKPNNTNFGIGITILKEPYSREEYTKAIEFAFEHDDTVLVEEFHSGKEYRFLVIDGEVIGVLNREAANVIGNGKSTIGELIESKNLDPLRGRGYVTPLEVIDMDVILIDYLSKQGLTLDSIPAEKERIYLRENSNISTGGDSIDFTDDVHISYKNKAIRAVSAIGADICGVDMIIQDIEAPADDENHTIIELNFNPAIHIHCYPYIGKNRYAGDKILQALFRGIV